MIFEFPDDTFALFIFPTEDKAEKYFAKLSSNLDLVKHTKRDLQTENVRLIAVVPGMKLCGLKWKSSRPNMLCVTGVDPGSEWFHRMVAPAMAEGFTTRYFE